MSNYPTSLKDELFKLAQLSNIEQEIAQLKFELKRIPLRLQESKQEFLNFEKAFLDQQQQQQTLEQQYKKTEFELNDSREKTKVRESKIYELKTTKEFQASSKEISQLKKQHQDQEKQLLEWIEQLEILNNALSPLKEQYAQEQQKIIETENQLQNQREETLKKLAEKEVLKQERCKNISHDLLEHYERVLTRKNPALSQVSAGICKECSMQIPPQLAIQIQKYQEIFNCPSCYRILWVGED